MAKAKVKFKGTKIAEAVANASANTGNTEQVQNGLADALGLGGGFGGFNPFNLPVGPGGFPGTEQISNVNTLFKNLRWYFVSNFRQLLSQVFVEIGLVQTVCILPVEDALRGGIEIHSKQLDEDQIKQVQISMDRDNDLNTVGQAAIWNRLFGGAGVIILTDQDPEEPLDLEALGPDDPMSLRACDLWELFWDKQNTEGYDPSIQSENFEHYDYYGEKVHKSRVMRMKGLEAPSFNRPRLRGWGFSVVEILVRSINQYLKASDLGFEVLDEFKLDVYKIKNLVNTLLSPNGQQKIFQRVQLANLGKNYQNAVVMDSEDDFDHKQLSFAGLAEAMAGIRKQVAADMRMPMTKLFGSSESGGIGNNDQNDLENYNAMVESQVRNKIKYEILRVIEIKCQMLFGFIPDDIEIKFVPLRVLSAVDEETVKTSKFNRVFQAQQAGLITTYEFRESCNKGSLLDITLDNSGDNLNPDDPEIDDLVAEGVNNPLEPVDIDDPGTGRDDIEKVRLTKGEYGGSRGESVEPIEEDEGVTNSKKKFKIFTKLERIERILKNSVEFDKASYEADGGDEWIDSRRQPFFENPGNVDEAIWAKAKDASMKAFGKDNWKFVVWFYKKHGGRFS